MHAALRTTELRTIIFKQLPPTTLVALATTCKALSAAALEILWYELKDFKPLAMLLPNSERGPEVVPVYILPKDVDRIRYYGPFVRRLTVQPLPSHLPPSTLEQMIVALGDDDLFPLLRHLEYNGPSVYAPCLHRIIPHTLLSLAVTMVDSHDCITQLERREITAVATLKNRDRSCIKGFSLALSSTRIRWPVADILAGWDSLQALSLTGQIEKEAMDVAICLPHLRSLFVRCLPGDRETLYALSWTLEKRLRLPLQHLDLRYVGLPSVASFLDSLPTRTRLDISKVQIKSYYCTSYLKGFCQALQRRCILYALENLVLEPAQEALQSPNYVVYEDDVTAYDIRSLLCFEWLCHCTISVPSALVIDNNDLRDMAQAWPRIRTLCLRGVLSSTTRCTLEGLLHFARHCNRLERLTISLQGSIIATPKEKLDIVHHNLHHLDVLNSPIIAGQEPRVASFLCLYFPSISRISSTAGPTSYVHAWEQVMATYRSFLDFSPYARQLDPRDAVWSMRQETTKDLGEKENKDLELLDAI